MPTREEILAQLNGEEKAPGKKQTNASREQILAELNGEEGQYNAPVQQSRMSSVGSASENDHTPLNYSAKNLEYLKNLDAGSKVERSWNSGWGSVKSSLGAGYEWIGLENDIQMLEDYGRGLKERGMAQSEANYMPMKDFEYEDLWTENFWTVKAPTIIPSMISLMGPAIVAGSAGTLATEASLGALWPLALAEPSPFGEIALSAAGAVGGIAAASSTSRLFEGIMEAGGSWSEIVQRLEADGYSPEDARKVAGAGAANVFRRNWALVGMDAMEFALLFSPLKGIGGGFKAFKGGQKLAKRYGRHKTVSPGFKAAATPVVNQLMKSAAVTKRISKAVPTGVKVTTALAAQAGMEGTEELWQAWISSQAINAATGKPEESFEEFWARPETKEAVVLGAIGGLAMQGLGSSAGGVRSMLKDKAEAKEKEARKKAKRTMELWDNMSTETDPIKQEEYRHQFAVEYMGEMVAAGKGQQIKERMDHNLKKGKIEKEVYERNMPFINKFINIFDSLSDEFDAKQRGQVVELIAEQAKLSLKIDNFKAANKEMPAPLVTKGTKIEQSRIDEIEEQIDMVLNPEKYEEEATEGKPGKTAAKVQEEAFTSIEDDSKEEEAEKFENPPAANNEFVSEEAPVEKEEKETEKELRPIEELEAELAQFKESLKKPGLKNDEKLKIIQKIDEFEKAIEQQKQTKKPSVDVISTIKEKIETTVRTLKRGTPILGGISKSKGQKKNGYTFTNESGEEFTFYDHNSTISADDLTKPAHLELIEPKKGGKNVIENADGKPVFKYPGSEKEYHNQIKVIGPNNKELGNLRQSTKEEFAASKEARAKANAEKRESDKKNTTGYAEPETEGVSELSAKEKKKIRKDRKEKAWRKFAIKASSGNVGGPFQAIPELITVAMLEMQDAAMTFKEFYDKMIKKLHEKGILDKLGKNPLGMLKKVYDHVKEARITQGIDKLLNVLAEEKGMEGIDEDTTIDSVIQRFDSQLRTAEDINKVHAILQDFEAISGIPNSLSMGYLYQLTHDPKFDESNIKESLKALDKMHPEAARLGKFLNGTKDGQLVSLMVTMKSLHSLPFIYYNNPSRKGSDNKHYHPQIANKGSQEGTKNLITAKNRMASFSEEDAANNLLYFDHLRTEAMNRYFDNKTPETRYAIVETELAFLKHQTGLDWTPFLEGYKKESATYKDEYWRTRNHRKDDGSVLYNFILTDGSRENRDVLETKKELEDKIFTGGQIGTLSSSVIDPTKIGYAMTFRGVNGNLLYGLIEGSDLIDASKIVHTVKGKFVSKNPMVQYWRSQKRSPLIFMTDGIRNDNNRYGQSMGDLSSKDLWAMMLINFMEKNPKMDKNHYAQFIEQLGDKSTNIMVESRKYTPEQAKAELALIKKDHKGVLPGKEEEANEITILQVEIQDLMEKGIIPRGNSTEIAQNFYDNYKINKLYNDLYYFGTNYDHYADQVKRAGSSASNGKQGNFEIEGGLGKKLKYVVLPDPTMDLKNTYHKNLDKLHKITDGVIYISEAFSKKVNKSFGSIYDYHTSLKANYSKVNPETGERTLLKSHAIILNQEMVNMFPSLQGYFDILNNEKNPVDIVSFESSAKKRPGQKVSSLKNPHIETDSTEHFRMQNDLRHPSELRERKMPIQLARHIMQFDEGQGIQNSFNEAMRDSSGKFSDEVLGKKTFKEMRAFLLGKIPDTERNQEIREYLLSELSILHKYVGKMSAVTFASQLEKNVLNMKVKGALFTPIPLPGVDLKAYRNEKGKGMAGEAYIPAESALKGQTFFATRVPSSGMHSTAYLKAIGSLPASMGNVMAIPTEMSAIAGEDFDGDQRHIWGKWDSKDLVKKQKTVIKVGNSSEEVTEEIDLQSRISSNEAFDQLEGLYQLNSTEEKDAMFDKLTDPISIQKTKDILEKFPTVEQPNKLRPSAFVKAYNDNKDSGKMISIAARSNATYSWLRNIKATLEENLEVPLFNGKKVLSMVPLRALHKGSDVERTNAANLNISLDNLKEQMLSAMGLNQNTGTVFIALEQFGLIESSVIALMNQPVIREYIEYVKENGSEISENDNSRSFKEYAELLMPGSTKGKQGAYNQLMSGAMSVNAELLNKKDNNYAKLAYLSILNKATFAFSTYRKAAKITKLTERGVKSFTEYYQAVKLMAEITTPKADGSTSLGNGIDITAFNTLPQIAPAKEQMKFMDDYYTHFTPYNSARSKSYIKAFEKLYARVFNKVIKSPFNDTLVPNESAAMTDDKMEALTNTIDAMLMGEYFKASKTRTQARKDANSAFRELKEANEGNYFLEMLAIEEGRLVVKQGLNTTDHSADIEVIRLSFEELRKSNPDLIKDIAYYDLREFGFTPLYRSGATSYFYSMEFHKELGESMEKTLAEWNLEKLTEIPESVMNAIMKQNPALIPTVEFESNSEGDNVITSRQGHLINPKYNPKYVISFIAGKPLVYTRQGQGANSTYNDEKGNVQNLEDFSIGYEGTPQQDSDEEIKHQIIDDVDGMFAVPELEDTEVRDYIMAELAKLFPGVKVFTDAKAFQAYVDKHVGQGKTVLDLQALGASFKDSIYINPKKAVQTTRLHEYSHLYFDALRSKDPKMAEMMLELFNGNEEAMIEAMAQAGVDMATVKLKGSKLARFKRMLQMFWAKVKAMFGVTNRKNAAMIAMERMMQNHDRVTWADFHTKIIKFQGNVRETKSDIKKRMVKILDVVTEKYPSFKGDFRNVNHGMLRRIVSGRALEHMQGDNFKVKTFYERYESGKPIKLGADGISFTPLSRDEFISELYAGERVIYQNESQHNKNIISERYESYSSDHLEIEENHWPFFDTEEKWEKLIKNKSRFKGVLNHHIKKLEEMDNIAADHLKRVLMAELRVNGILEEAKAEIGKSNQPFTRTVFDMVVTKEMAPDLHDSDAVSGMYSLMSPAGARSNISQTRVKEIHTLGKREFNANDEHTGRLSDLRNQIEIEAKALGVSNPLIKPEPKADVSNHPIFTRDNEGRLIFRNIVKASGKMEKLLSKWLASYKATVEKFDHNQDGKTVFHVPMVQADLPELFSHINGDMKGIKSYYDSIMKTLMLQATGDTEVENEFDNNYVKGDNNQPILLLDYKIEQQNKAKTFIEKANAIRKIKSKTRWLRYQAKTKSGRDAKGNFIKSALKDPTIGIGIGFNENALSSRNIGVVAERHVSGVIHKNFLLELAPKLVFYRDFMHNSNNGNYARWMQMMDDKMLYGINPESVFGRYGEQVQWLVNFTAWRYLAINPMAAVFNGMAGITQTTTHHGLMPILRGIRRIVKDMKIVDGNNLSQKFSKGIVTSIGIRFMQSIRAVNTSQDTELSVTSRVGNMVSNVAFSPITFIEYINHAYTTIGLMSDEEWEVTKMRFTDNEDVKVMSEEEFQAKYKKPSKDVLTEDDVDLLLDESKRIHGAYHPFSKRGINNTPEGRMVMQFKNWLPDVVLAHIQNEFVDMNGVIRKGILTSAMASPAMDLYKSVFTGSPTQVRAKIKALPEIDKRNLHKFMRELLMIGSIAMLISSLAAGYDDERKDLARVMGDIGFIYDIDNAVFLLDGPAPVLGTIGDILTLSKEIVKISYGAEGAKYKRDSKFGKKGDYKAPIKFINLLPVHKGIKSVFYENE